MGTVQPDQLVALLNRDPGEDVPLAHDKDKGLEFHVDVALGREIGLPYFAVGPVQDLENVHDVGPAPAPVYQPPAQERHEKRLRAGAVVFRVPDVNGLGVDFFEKHPDDDARTVKDVQIERLSG